MAGGPAPHGSLTSRSTHQTGLVSNQDLAPTVLGWFGVPVPSQMRGHFITGHVTGLGLSGALTDERGIRRVLRQREIVLLASALLWLAAVGLCLSMVERRLRRVGTRAKERQVHVDEAIRAEWLARWLVFAVALLPLALLLQPFVSNGSTWVVLLEVLAAVLFFGWLLSLVSKKRAAAGLGAVGILTVLAVVGDRATGGWLSSRTLTGPNVRVAVAVGMGPMQIGACVAAAILAAGAMIRGARTHPMLRWFWLGLTAVVMLLLAFPFMGSVTAAAAAGLTGLAVLGALALRRPPSRRVWEGAGIALGAALLVLGVVHLAARASFAHSVATADGSSKAALPLAVAVAAHSVSGWALLLFASQWTVRHPRLARRGRIRGDALRTRAVGEGAPCAAAAAVGPLRPRHRRRPRRRRDRRPPDERRRRAGRWRPADGLRADRVGRGHGARASRPPLTRGQSAGSAVARIRTTLPTEGLRT